MSLSTIVRTLRWILVIFCLGNFGMDVFFVKIYQDHDTLAYMWRFPVQMGLSGALAVVYIISAFVICCSSHRSYYPGRSAGFFSMVISVIRGIIILGVSIAMLYTTVTPLRLKTRTWFILPFGRNTDQAHALHDDYSQYDQHDLFKCPHERDFDIGALDLVCSFDRSTMILGTAIGALAIIEVLFTFFYDFGGSSEGDYEYSHHMDIEQYKNHPAQGPQYESVPLNTQNKS